MNRVTHQGLTAEQWQYLAETNRRMASVRDLLLPECQPAHARLARRAERIANILAERES